MPTQANRTSNLLSEDNIDIQKYLFKILKYWYWFGIAIVIALGGAYFINHYTNPVYSVSSSILVRDKSNAYNSGIESIMNELNLKGRFNRKNVENEKGILGSYTLINRVIKKLDFKVSYFGIGTVRTSEQYKKAPFTVELDTNFFNAEGKAVYITIIDETKYLLKTQIKNKDIEQELSFGEPFVNEAFHFSIKYKGTDLEDLQTSNYYFIINNEEELSKRYCNKLEVEPFDKKSSILVLNIQGRVREKEVAFLNTLCDEYLLMDLEEKNGKSNKTLEFVDQQLSIINDSLKVAENGLQSFKEENRMMDLSHQGSVIFKRLEDLLKEKAQYEIEHQYYDYLIEYLKTANNDDIIAPAVKGIGEPLVSSLVLELNQLSSKFRIESQNMSDKNPVLLRYEEKIKNIKELIKENIRNVKQASNIAFSRLKEEIYEVDKRIKALPITEKKLIAIQRKFTLNNDIYTFLLEKRAEVGIAKASNMPENKILDYASVNRASIVSPKKERNYLIAIILALIIPFLIIVVNDLIDNKIHDRKQVEAITSIPIIADIGHNSKQTELPVYKFPRSAISESYRKLRTNLKYSLLNQTEGSKVIAITSTISGEGKSFTAVNTASVLAALDKKVVLLGLDLRKPTLHKFFNKHNENGISEYLCGELDYQNAIRETEVPNLSVMLSGSIPPNPSELIELPKMRDLIEQLRSEYDYVILDTPPIALVTDALLLSSMVDVNLYVMRLGYSRITVIDFLNQIVENNKINMNIILNDVKQTGYYSYKYNYNYKYGGHYYSYNYYEDDDYQPPYLIRLINQLKKRK